MWHKIKTYSQKVCDVLELLLAAIVLIAIVITIVMFIPEIAVFVKHNPTPARFLVFMEEVLSIVIGVEFLKMLCKPSTDNVIEVIVFLIARHMILVTTSAVDNLLSIIGISILFLIRNYLHKEKRKKLSEKAK